MSRIGVIGLGNVGANLVASLIVSNVADTINLYNKNKEAALGYLEDFQDMRKALGFKTALVYQEDLSLLYKNDVIVVCIRVPFENTQQEDVRIGGLRANAGVIREIAQHLKNFEGTVLVVTNPVDIMARLLYEHSGLAAHQVFGIGSNLDSVRFQRLLENLYSAYSGIIEGSVYGEHGDMMVVAHSTARLNGQPTTYETPALLDKQVVAYASRISKRVGRTRYGPVGVTLRTIQRALGQRPGVEELSTLDKDVFMGLPVQFDDRGSGVTMIVQLSAQEISSLDAARVKLRHIYALIESTSVMPI